MDFRGHVSWRNEAVGSGPFPTNQWNLRPLFWPSLSRLPTYPISTPAVMRKRVTVQLTAQLHPNPPANKAIIEKYTHTHFFIWRERIWMWVLGCMFKQRLVYRRTRMCKSRSSLFPSAKISEPLDSCGGLSCLDYYWCGHCRELINYKLNRWRANYRNCSSIKP